MLWGKHKEMLDTLDGFDADAFVVFKRKLVKRIHDQGSRSRRFLDVASISATLERMTAA